MSYRSKSSFIYRILTFSRISCSMNSLRNRWTLEHRIWFLKKRWTGIWRKAIWNNIFQFTGPKSQNSMSKSVIPSTMASSDKLSITSPFPPNKYVSTSTKSNSHGSGKCSIWLNSKRSLFIFYSSTISRWKALLIF